MFFKRLFSKNKFGSSYSQVTVNGKTIKVQGNNITVLNDRIIVDGKRLDESMDFKNITIVVEGNCNSLDACGDVEVKGDCGRVDCNGSCHIEGNVLGNVGASGSVTCGNVGGDIDASGSVRCTRR